MTTLFLGSGGRTGPPGFSISDSKVVRNVLLIMKYQAQ